jgi:protein phosphatase
MGVDANSVPGWREDEPVIYDFARGAILGSRRRQEDMAQVAVEGSAPDWQQTTGRGTRLFAVLADGMGGHAGGSLASRIVCETMVGSFSAHDDVGDALSTALAAANMALEYRVANDQSLTGMGSTVVGVNLDARGLDWISVGDSLLYLWRQGRMRQLNADHSLAPEIDRLAEAGKISWEEARNSPRRHYLRSAVTGEPIEMIDRPEAPIPLEVDDVVLIASDGLHTLDTAVISAVLATAKTRAMAALVDDLLGRVEARREPHQDNATVVAIRVERAPG